MLRKQSAAGRQAGNRDIMVAPHRTAKLNQESSNSNSGSARRGDGGAHPVLARLPDVSGQPPAKQRSARATVAGFVDYRFDLPVGVEARTRQPVLPGAESPARQITQPHVFQRSPRGEFRSRAYGSASRVLPNSDPFSIPATSLLDRLAPVGQFLVLFALFTAVGTFLLSNRREQASSEPARPRPRSASNPSGVRQSLEPAPPSTDHPSIATPSAFGPLGSNAESATLDPQTAVSEAGVVTGGSPIAFSEKSTTAEPPVATNGYFPNRLSFMESVKTPRASSPLLARADGDPLPQVQTTEPTTSANGVGDDPARISRPPAMARLPGVIFEAPRNAYHDNHQPGLH